MLVCIPTNDNAGAEATLCDHFGSAPFFTLYDTTSDQVQTISNGNEHHSHGTCHPLTALSAYNIESVVCRGMGRRAIEMMNAQGIRIYRSTGPTVRETVAAIKGGMLAEMSPKEACAGHGGRRLRSGDDSGCDHR